MNQMSIQNVSLKGTDTHGAGELFPFSLSPSLVLTGITPTEQQEDEEEILYHQYTTTEEWSVTKLQMVVSTQQYQHISTL